MKKQLVVLSAAAIVAAAAVPALAFENEFHGMFLSGGFVSTGYNGSTGTILLGKDIQTNNFFDQRARIQYIAKASDDLKLVTHFELDTKYGGRYNGKYNTACTSASTTNNITCGKNSDGGGADADGISLETKNVYLDFNVPGAPVNAKFGIMPWADAYKSTFGLVDDTGVLLTTKAGPATVAAGWLRIFDDGGDGAITNSVNSSANVISGKKKIDLYVLDAKFAPSKAITVGANYYRLLRDTGVASSSTGLVDSTVTNAVAGSGSAVLPATGYAKSTNMIGFNVAAAAGPANVDFWGGYQFGTYREATASVAKQKLSAYGLGTVAKIQAGPGKVNFAALYLSGEKDNTQGKQSNWQFISANQTYFNDANSWFLVRNAASLNTSAAIGSNDLTKGGRGLFGVFAGYNGNAGKVLFGANAGYAQTAVAREAAGVKEKKAIGTEVNAMVGYQLYDNLSIKLNGAMCFLGAGTKKAVADGGISGITGYHATSGTYYTDGKPDNPYLANLMLAYTF